MNFKVYRGRSEYKRKVIARKENYQLKRKKGIEREKEEEKEKRKGRKEAKTRMVVL